MNPEKLRRAFISSIPADLFADRPLTKFLYLPAAHARALDPDNMLVVGIRGAGKSFWWQALQNEEQRKLISSAFENRMPAGTQICAGWGEVPNQNYPDSGSLQSLLQNHSAQLIWKTVILRQVTPKIFDTIPRWDDRVAWVTSHPEETARCFFDADAAMRRMNRKQLILFDALERTAGTWEQRNSLLKGLLQNLIELRMTAALRAKAFLRPDMLEDSSVTAFPDASKIISGKASIEWSRADLYGLLWQYLGNADEGGEEFRDFSGQHAMESWREQMGAWRVPLRLNHDEAIQEALFVQIAGMAMGNNLRRGKPYSWLPKHLVDPYGQISPRSFLAALREAALATSQGHTHALHWDAIKKGIQTASGIRVSEIKEDCPWIEQAMEPLRDLAIPCAEDEIIGRWARNSTLEKIRSGPLQPHHLDDKWHGLSKDLENIGVFMRMKDGRVNLSDVYRVGFGLKRRGGVKPVH